MIDKAINVGFWLAVVAALGLVLSALEANAGERDRRSRVIAVEPIETHPRYRAPCPRTDRYTRRLGNCLRPWEKPRPIFIVQPKPGKGVRKKVVGR